MQFRDNNNQQKTDKLNTYRSALSTLSGFKPRVEAINAVQKTAKSSLTENPTTVSLEKVSGNATGYNVKQTFGGTAKNLQPPVLSGFSMPAIDPCDCNRLPGVARNRTPLCGNTCSVSERTLYGSRQPYNCHNVKQTFEVNAMQCTQTYAIGAPAPMGDGLPVYTPFFNRTCLFIPVDLFAVIQQARHDKARKGRGHAYTELLNLFHAAILPAFFIDCQGNLSEVARLLGIHRTTIKDYCSRSGIHPLDMMSGQDKTDAQLWEVQP